MITRQTSLSKNIVQFCRFLRQNGFNVGAEEEAATLRALQYIDYSSIQIFLLALKTILCRSKMHLDEFDNLFDGYWKELEKAVDAKKKDEKNNIRPLQQEASFKSLKAWLHGNRNDGMEETATYSIQESLSQRDFSAVTEDEMGELMQIIKALSKRLAARTNRRYEPSRKIDMPDLRQTVRKNLRCGGELLNIVHRKPKRNRVKLVLLCDVSRSMELYTVFLIQFIYAFHQVYRRMETFVFSTSLERITPALKQKSFREALHLLGSEKSRWAGGTRIGESLGTFVKDYAKTLLDSKTIVIIVSDGWDSGNIDALKKSMEYIHNKSKKVVWLNPMAGYSAYRPDVAGMKAAMPYIDTFASVHNAESLRRLARLL
jgi:uncharacterized protein with von Willebrand factor type A (vWA) domain